MREIFQLALFEWKEMGLRGFLTGLLACVLIVLLINAVANLDPEMNLGNAIPESVFLIMGVLVLLGNVHVKEFRLSELSPSVWSSAFYTYARRLPVPEKQLLYSRILVKGVQAPVIMIVSICIVTVFADVFPFTFTDSAFYSFLVFWGAIAFFSIYVALEEVGIRFQRRFHLYGVVYIVVFIYFLLYFIVWVWLVPIDLTFMAFSIFLAEKYPALAVLTAYLIVMISLLTIVSLGNKRINRKGDINATPD
ncbi:hypothetical protein [Natribacillus halophilus]|uniref:ABC-2 family transporter protein n=1 Tax=Natribacillus halophilus TaxID=549003 RepID=A0A1G8NL16_9BACI|nr:hypothetical protein [Natribacillus halophilus]SDI80807.1 hypothetical protein SAMN04488123_106131 [Natribacillus halophilus]